MQKLYVIVRKDLSPSQIAVQAGHAVAEYLVNDSKTWKNEILIYLGVPGLRQLHRWMMKLDNQDVEYTTWREPDINNEVTAIASTGSSEYFKKLNLL